MSRSVALPRAAAILSRPALFTPALRALSIWAERRRLARLDAHMLGDIGLTRVEAAAEANRPIWDLPR